MGVPETPSQSAPRFSADMPVGTKVRHRESGEVVTLVRRKEMGDLRVLYRFHPGWWCGGGGGLADFVIDAERSDWEVLDGNT
ncbi:MAG: hypothetical protein JWN67_5001 [Actinomycetia bacterium]|nr:hypothetical protein [Actinomycetes bacterium]